MSAHVQLKTDDIQQAASAGVKLNAEDVTLLKASLAKTDDSFKYCKLKPSEDTHIGLSLTIAATAGIKATVKSIYHDSKFFMSTSEVPAGVSFGIILDKTNFYAEAGGQEWDTGSLFYRRDGPSRWRMCRCTRGISCMWGA